MEVKIEVSFAACAGIGCTTGVASAQFVIAQTDLEFGSSAGVIFLMEADICESMDSCLWTARPLDVARLGVAAERLGDPSSKLDKPESCCSKGDSQDRCSGTAGSWDIGTERVAYPLGSESGTRSRSGETRQGTSPESLRMILIASAEAVLTCQVHSIRFEASASLGNFAERLTFALPAPGTRDTLCWHTANLNYQPRNPTILRPVLPAQTTTNRPTGSRDGNMVQRNLKKP